MPTIATMNGIHRSAAASAPLDLRTRERAGGRSLAGPDTPRRTGEGELGNGAPSPAELRGRRPPVPPPAPTSSRPPSPDKSRRVAPAPGGSCPSRLPFRKRPFPSGAETSHRDTHVAAESASLAQRQSPPKRLKEEAGAGDRLCEAPSRCIGALEQSGDVYSVGPVHHFNPYRHHHRPVYPFYCISPAPITKRPLPAPLAFQTEPQMANTDVAMATHQDEDGDTPLHIAVVQGKEDLVHMLIYILVLACRDLNIYNNLRQTPLHLAVIMQNAAMVDALLRAGADAATLDRNGQTALHLCCEYNHPDCLSILLLHSSTCLEIRNYEGLSPLHVAVQGGHRDLARMLLEAGADINAMDIKSGQSPLMHAVENNNVDMVHFLIESGSDVNTHSYSGNTALHSACGRGQVDTVRLLMKNGADCSLKNYHNDTPVMVAKNKMITDVLRGKSLKLARSQDQHVVLSSSHSNDAT